ncbi:saccharopine dehydrogenase NADP-binding domain-containing protein [candidate division KSB1 bacterium]|nr:saccharopine dehydrogenase NADP-binding domain-containing protein [candidate division KSB1 bacterium]
MKITVLGAGMVGSAIAADLAMDPNFKVIVADISEQTLAQVKQKAPVDVVETDLSDAENITHLVAGSDLVICAVPGFMGFKTLHEIINAGKNVIDISFFEQDPFELDDLAKARGVTAVVDCGVAPGLCNILAGYVHKLMDKTESYMCYVGGLPRVRTWPYEYKAVFSPSDVLQEYIRPARFVENGRLVVKPALSDVELIDLPAVGTLEAFNTDGLRSLAKTMDIPDMREKTLRYPGHAGLMRIFRESGFFDTNPVQVDGQIVIPLSVTSRLLFEQWHLDEGELDFTVMRVVIKGQQGGGEIAYSYDLYDKFDKDTQTTSMARTTGYTCTIVARQFLNGLFGQKGICPPEYIGGVPGCFEDLMTQYQLRNIQVRETVSRE